MSAKQVTCYIAECDDCGTEYEHDYTPHWPSAREAIDDAVNSADWWASDEQLLCDDCKGKPHTVVPGKFDPDGCDRCPHPAEEHTERAVSQTA